MGKEGHRSHQNQRLQKAGAGERRIDHVRNEDSRPQLRQEGVVEQVGRKREVWKKHVEEQVGSITEIVMRGVVPRKRPRGRPRKRWSDAY